MQELWQRFASDCACFLEVCIETLALERTCLQHLHVFLRANERLRLPPSRLLAFEDVVPQVSAVVGGQALQRQRLVVCIRTARVGWGILFDEIHPAQVAAQRLLFQAGTSFVALGCSSTNCFSYTVYVHRVRMVLCSNTWAEELAALTSEDRDWIRRNSVVQEISEPCWITPVALSLPPVHSS